MTRSTANASGWSGTRTPIESFAPPSCHGKLAADRGSTMVKGPGHSADANRSARSSKTAMSIAAAIDGTRTGSVRSLGRRLASKTRSVAAGSSGRQANP